MTITEVKFKPAAVNNTGAGCVIEDIPETEDTYSMPTALLGGDSMSMRNIILKQSDGEDGAGRHCSWTCATLQSKMQPVGLMLRKVQKSFMW